MMTQSEPGLILHIGASKCGSSSLQAKLSEAPTLRARDGRRFAYVTIDHNGRMLEGAALTQQARRSPRGYMASGNVTRPETLTAQFQPNLPRLRDMRAAGVTPILSQEGWQQRAGLFERTRLLEGCGGGVHVVYYVRPPVDWLNSAWWQWGVWDERDLADYVDSQIDALDWPARVAEWRAVPGVASVETRLATRDITAQFFDRIGVVVPPTDPINTGVPAAFLAFLLRNRQFRPDAHRPAIEFLTARLLPPARYPAPWVMTPELIAHVFDRLDGMAGRLGAVVAEDVRREIDADNRWHDPGAYADRTRRPLSDLETAEALTDLIGTLSMALGDDGDEARREAGALLAGRDRDTRLAAADRILCDLAERVQRSAPRKTWRTRLGRLFRALG